MKKLLLALLVLTVLAGCATQAQQKYKQLEMQYISAFRSMNSCVQPLMEAPVVRRLNERFLFDTNDPRSVEKLALKTQVTEQEAKDLTDFSVLIKPCDKLAIEDFSKIHPEYVASLAKMFAEADADLAKAINKELTIGDINQRTVDRNNRWHAEFSQIGQRIESQLDQAHQYELTQRQIAAQSLRTWAYQQQLLNNQQQLINATKRPITTNCQYIGNILHCTQY